MAKFEIAKSRINCKKKKPERFISLLGFLKKWSTSLFVF